MNSMVSRLPSKNTPSVKTLVEKRGFNYNERMAGNLSKFFHNSRRVKSSAYRFKLPMSVVSDTCPE